MMLLAVLLLVLITYFVVAARAADLECDRAAGSQEVCATTEAGHLLSPDEGPERRPEVVHFASHDIGAVATASVSTPFFDFAPVPQYRLRGTIINPAVLAVMNQMSKPPDPGS